MKARWMVVLGLAALGVMIAVLLARSGHAERNALEKTRRELSRQGFKLDLAEFDFSSAEEMRDRAVALSVRRPLALANVSTLTSTADNAALVVWKQPLLDSDSAFGRPLIRPPLADPSPEKDPWLVLGQTLEDLKPLLDGAVAAALSGPIRFNLNANGGNGMLLPHLAPLKSLDEMLCDRAMLALHDHDRDDAWTNLLAATRLVTAWQTEPVEISQLVRFNLVNTIFDATWQVLQAGDWPEDRLAGLQREWEGLDVFTNLPETVAFTRASAVAVCRQDRARPSPKMPPLSPSLKSLRQAVNNLADFWQEMRYRRHGTYVDENDLLLFYRDRELELRRAIQSPSWADMMGLPGVTNRVIFQSKFKNHPSRMLAVLNQRQLVMATQAQGRSLISRAAETEARRRLIVTAIALERFHGRHGGYPRTLQELAPDLLAAPLMDFMDGRPLRYATTGDGHFVLYSIGLDGVDDGGKMPPTRDARLAMMRARGAAVPASGFDLVWPRPASESETAAYVREKQRVADEIRQAALDRQAMAEKRAQELRLATVEKLLADARADHGIRKSEDPVYQGRPLSRLLRNEAVTGTNKPGLDELLTLKQVITGQEPGTATFEFPINYDTMTNLGALFLWVDADEEIMAESDHQPADRALQTCERATNGNCLLHWNTTYDPPGRHALRAEFMVTNNFSGRLPASSKLHLGSGESEPVIEATGPIAPYFSSNLCQFSQADDEFTDEEAVFCAKLAETNGIYKIIVQTPEGAPLKTFTGRTSNGVIKVVWDLRDDHGKRYTGTSVNGIYEITLPDSGRTQIVK